MADNQEKGQKTKSKTKATQKDVWADEGIDMLLDIFSSETIQSSLEAARSPKYKNSIYHEVKVRLESKGKLSCLIIPFYNVKD